MVGIGHLLMEAEMQKEALSPKAKTFLRGAAGVIAAIGGASYLGHWHGRRQAEYDHPASPGLRRPGVGTFFTAGLAGTTVGEPITAGLAGMRFARRGYDERLGELVQEKKAGLLILASPFIFGSQGYHRKSRERGREKAEQDFANGLSDNMPGLRDVGVVGQRAYKERMAELKGQQ